MIEVLDQKEMDDLRRSLNMLRDMYYNKCKHQKELSKFDMDMLGLINHSVFIVEDK